MVVLLANGFVASRFTPDHYGLKNLDGRSKINKLYETLKKRNEAERRYSNAFDMFDNVNDYGDS